MHAARAVKANREKREEKLKPEPRRSSAASQLAFSIPRSPAVSIGTKNAHPPNDDSNNLNFSYIGFLIAVFGAVPLIVGTFVEVPALWEIGLGVTLVGLFIGVVFWCTELCAEAKKFSQKKNQLSTRGKIEDSNLLQVPDRKSKQENGIESRRSSFQSDSVSLITPMAQSFGSPNHNPHSNNIHGQGLGSKQSISQFSSSDNSKSNDSSATLNSGGGRANGNLAQQQQPKLLLRGTRKDDSRVVSLVQPDPGLEDDSDSDAETVIEAPTGKPKIIQVQTCQEKAQRRRSSPYDSRRESGVVLSVAGHNSNTIMNSDKFHIENEFVPPLMPLAHHHGTIRMPVMPQEVDKLQKCECGRYLLTDRDKLVGVRLSDIAGGGGEKAGGGSSLPPTTYNSPSLAGTILVGAGTAPATRKIFSKGHVVVGGVNSGLVNNALEPNSNSSSANDLVSGGDPVQQLSSDINKVINVNPSSQNENKSTREISSGNSKKHVVDANNSFNPTTTEISSQSRYTLEESVVQVEPTVNSSELLVHGDKTEREIVVGNGVVDVAGDETKKVPIVSTPPGTNKPRKIPKVEKDSLHSENNMEEDEKDKVLAELLELTEDDGNDSKTVETTKQQNNLEIKSGGNNGSGSNDDDDDDDAIKPQIGNDDDIDEEFNSSFGERPPFQEEKREHQRNLSVSRPTSLALPVILSDASKSSQNTVACDPSSSESNSVLMSSASSASSASTVVFIGDQSQNPQIGCEKYTKNEEKQSNEGESTRVELTKKMSLDELLDKIEQKQDGEVLAVVM